MTEASNNITVADEIADLCASVLKARDNAQILVVADRSLRASGEEQRVTWCDGASDLPEQEGGGRFELAIVDTDSAVIANEPALSQLLAALRDRFARRVLVLDQRQAMGLNDYLALGFERMPGAATDDRQFLFDPDAESRQREWNNARNWANPENFERYRW